ncbi:MAG: exodeoxyribonuclease VII large subunit [Planctomycetota bacterium]|nr:exodeoxyribonuclease VII large subunit [Planctomycetota bacterium]
MAKSFDELPVLSVSELTRDIRALVESNMRFVWLEGEVSNCMQARSGHLYLTLKDDNAQISAVVWRTSLQRLQFDVQDGLHVIAGGPVQVYPPRGTYQLIVERMIPQGVGPLELAFRQLQEKLEREGLFAPERKRSIPTFPQRIALITSPAGAAVRDILQVLQRRWPKVDVVILPVAVQGEFAAREIANALRIVHQIPGVDVVIAGRGGGSLEDLWSFNEEVVARAIAACRVPVISAVGHEVDVTIADLVADRRALTPSEAAELAVPIQAEVERSLHEISARLRNALLDRVRHARTRLESFANRPVLKDPLRPIRENEERLDQLGDRLQRAMAHRMERIRSRLVAAADSLEALSPLKVLSRGFSITRSVQEQRIVRSIDDISVGDQIETQLSDGRIVSRVESVQ